VVYRLSHSCNMKVKPIFVIISLNKVLQMDSALLQAEATSVTSDNETNL